MIKNRSFMFGLGAGLIIGALLLQLMVSGGAAPLTREQLVKEAARLNLMVTDNAEESTENDEDGAEQNGQDLTEVTPAEASQPVASPESSPAADPTAAAAPEQPTEPSAPAASAEAGAQVTVAPVNTPATPVPAAAGTVSVRIPTGATLAKTADLLAEAGVVKDKTEFLNRAINRRVNTKIQYGAYSFIEGENIDSIIDKLVTLR